MKKIKLTFRLVLLLFAVCVSSLSLCAESYANDNKKRTDLSIDSIKSISCVGNNCFFPGEQINDGDEDIHVVGEVNWDNDENLVLHTRGNIIFDQGAKIINKKNGSIILKAGMKPGKRECDYAVIFKDNTNPIQIEMLGGGDIKIYYNPTKESKKHKYLNQKYNLYRSHVNFTKEENLILYMLINNIYDLQNVSIFLSGNYALSQDINAIETKSWNNNKGFEPLKDDDKNMPFSGDFDGNGYFIENLYINRPEEKKVGLFGMCSGFESRSNIVENLMLRNSDITGNHYVGSIAGWATRTKIVNVSLVNFSIKSKDIAGGFIGAMYKVQFSPLVLYLVDKQNIETDKYSGYIAGSSNNCSGTIFFVLVDKKGGKEIPYTKYEGISKHLDGKIPYIGMENHTNIYDFPVIGKNFDFFKFKDLLNSITTISL